MADIEISYNNNTIATMSDSGTEILETNGTFLADDITIQYTKSGGGGNVTIGVSSFAGKIYYIDSSDGVLKRHDYTGTAFSQSVPSGSMVVLLWSGAKPPDGATLTNLTTVYSVSLGSRASYMYADYCKAV